MSTTDALSVVLVDDSSDVRSLLRTQLRLSGAFHVVGEGATGRQAVDLAAKHRPHVMLLDISMPDMDGLEALPLVALASPGTRVVVFSGFDEPELERRAMDLGAWDYVPKSLPVSELMERLSAVAANGDGAGSPTAPALVGDGWRTGGLLGQQTDHFPLLFEQADAGMAMLTLSGRLVRVNKALASLLARNPVDLVGCLLTDLVDHEQRRAIEELIGQVAGGAAAIGVDHGLVSRSAWLDTSFVLVRDSAAAPLYLFMQTRDIAEQRKTQRALRQSEERFRLLVESVVDYAIFLLDPAGHITSWNAGAKRIKGYSADEVLGRHFRMFYAPETAQAGHPEHELKIAAKAGRYQEEGWRIRKDGTRFWASVTITALRDESGHLVGFAKVLRELTERDGLAVARAEAARATELLAVIAHELRNPVGVMVGTAQMLADHVEVLTPVERVDLRKALVGSGSRIVRLMDDLLTASRLEGGALEVRPMDIDLGPILAQALLSAGGSAEGPSVELELGPDGDRLRVVADPDRLQQIVQNLVTNAVRHGAPPICVQVSVDDASVVISVLDHGPGVAEVVGGRVFDRFVTGDRAAGTGLGLFIVRELARAQGGDATYHRAGGTTRFAVRLPRGAPTS